MTNINVTPQFVLAGDATFTVSNGSGNHFTFRVGASTPSARFPELAYFIRLLAGPDNDDIDSYKYIGKLSIPVLPNERTGNPGAGQDPGIVLTAKSKYTRTSEGFRVACWALRAIWQVERGVYVLPPGYSIKHVGRCGRCGRTLTTPQSLDTGLGPECAAQLGVEWVERDTRQPALPVGEE